MINIEIDYREMSYLRALLQKDKPNSKSIDEESRKKLLVKFNTIENGLQKLLKEIKERVHYALINQTERG